MSLAITFIARRMRVRADLSPRSTPLLNTGTLYTDSAVVDGATYCYATTAVNTSNEESGYSNVVSNVQVPAP